MSVNYIHTEEQHNFKAAKEILPLLFKKGIPKSIIDVGCGLGTWLNVAQELGVQEILGIEGVCVDPKLLKISNEYFVKHDLTQPLTLSRKFDLCICLEVAEHLPEAAADVLLETLTKHADQILFSAAIPLQGGQNHVNEQWLSYWVARFSEKGFVHSDCVRSQIWRNQQIEFWYRQNIVMFHKPNNMNFNPEALEVLDCVIPELWMQRNRELERCIARHQKVISGNAHFRTYLLWMLRCLKHQIRKDGM